MGTKLDKNGSRSVGMKPEDAPWVTKKYTACERERTPKHNYKKL
jgi:hypothetical protein